MAPEKQNSIREEQVKKQLDMIANKGADRLSKQTIDQRISKEMRMKDKAVPNRLDIMTKKKYEEGADIIFQKWKIESQNEQSDLKFRHFEDRFHAYMKAWQMRVELALKVAAKNTDHESDQDDFVVSNNEEFLRTIEFVLPFLEHTSAEQMMRDATLIYRGDGGENVFQAEISRMFTESFPADHMQLLQKLYQDEEPTPQEYDFLRAELEWSFRSGAAYSKLMSKQKEKGDAAFDIRMTTAAMLLQSLSGPQRMKLLEGYKEPPAAYASQIREMVNVDFISIGQARLLTQKEIDRLNGLDGKDARENKDRLEEFTKLQSYLKDNKEEIFATRKKLREFKKAQAEWISDMPGGHYNRVGKLLTPKGVLGTYLAFNGALTTLANFGVSVISDPTNLPVNPGLWMGMGMTAAGLELSDGLGGMAPRPGEIAGKVLKDRKEPRRDKFVERMDKLEEMFSDPELATLYYSFGHNIVPAYKRAQQNKVERIPLEEVITVKGEGNKGDKIKEVCKQTGLSQIELEKKLYEWSKHLSDAVMGAGKKSWASQKEFMEKVDDETDALEGKRDVLNANRPPFFAEPITKKDKTTKEK